MTDFFYSYPVPNGTLGKGRNIFYQYHAPNGTDCNTIINYSCLLFIFYLYSIANGIFLHRTHVN